MKNINKQLKELHSTKNEINVNVEIPEVDKVALENFKAMINKNKQTQTKQKPRKMYKFIQRFALPACCLLFLAVALIPVYSRYFNSTPTPPAVYYTDDEAIKVDLTETEAKLIIQEKKDTYNFLFEDYSFKSALGFYSPENNELLSIYISLQETIIPRTTINLYFVFNNQFVLSSHDSYISNAEYSETDTYKLYKKEDSTYSRTLNGYLEYQDFKLYIQLDKINDDLFNNLIK